MTNTYDRKTGLVYGPELEKQFRELGEHINRNRLAIRELEEELKAARQLLYLVIKELDSPKDKRSRPIVEEVDNE